MTKKFKIDSNSPTPIYQQIADWMTENITSGTWEKGQKLQSEEELSRQLEINRGTLRKAISVLIEQGMLIRIHGKGTFVDEQKISYPFAQELISFAESMEAKGYTFQTNVLEKKIIHPNIQTQKKLDITDNDYVLYLQRVRLIENEPTIVLANWVSLKHCPGIDQEDFETVSLFSAIEKYSNSKITVGTRRFSAKALNQKQANLISMNKNDPVLHINQTTFLLNDIPIEHSEVLLRTDKYEVTSVLTR
ncbi:GntR family transcriptional regulator [Virgibacillus sp. MSP4-1]|uniref:GntR family transcriptional regulator n=1 Tax=Virgibacillus sp. MSP4-1 TaxID=2700081 RepID=UPI00039C0830|nr:GntR family transcriptional regulator [Virgibacillus sp. MSP4-1]QHS23401.1 GntR family transcriptional regulator [Virgibacillus sp. MSP4-1]